MPRHLRLAHFVVQPVIVWDDGSDITPGPALQPVQLTLAGMREMADNFAGELAKLEAELQGADKPAPVPNRAARRRTPKPPKP